MPPRVAFTPALRKAATYSAAFLKSEMRALAAWFQYADDFATGAVAIFPLGNVMQT